MVATHLIQAIFKRKVMYPKLSLEEFQNNPYSVGIPYLSSLNC